MRVFFSKRMLVLVEATLLDLRMVRSLLAVLLMNLV